MNFGGIHFADPGWLWLAVLGPVLLVVLFRHAAVRRREQLARVASAHRLADLTRSHSPARRQFSQFLLLAAAALFGIALARPQWGQLENRSPGLGEDVLFALDCSRSMLAEDVLPNRLQRAKYAILDFVRRHGTGRVGLVGFAGTAFLQCPLTFDYDAFEDALTTLDERALPVGGTDIGRALREAFHALEKQGPRKLIVLLTDGEDLEKGGVKEAEALAKAGVTVYAIGVGTAAGAELRTVRPNGQTELVREANGQIVRSRLDETTLTQVARATGGEYFPLGRLGEGLAKIGQAIETRNAASFARARTQGVERFHVPLTLALLLVIVESLIGTRRAKPAGRMMMTTEQRIAGITALLLLAPGAASGATNQLTVTHSAAPSFRPVAARDFYNLGVKRFTEGKFADAETAFQGALRRQEEAVQPLALYNLGHARFAFGAELLEKSAPARPARRHGERAREAGDQAVQSAEAALAANDLQQMVAAYQRGRGVRKELRAAYEAVYRALEVHRGTLEKWQRALGDFRSAAELNPADTNATHNARAVERALAKLVDSVMQTQMVTLQCAGTCAKLNDALAELKGRIPKGQLPAGPEDGDDEDDLGEPKLEELIGKKEAPGREGREMESSLSPEEAGNMLDRFKLGGNRPLPMGQGEAARPKDRKLRDW